MASVTEIDESVCPLPQIELIDNDGEPLESDWHRLEMNLLIEVVTFSMGGATDFFVGGNMFIYFNEEQARNRDYRGPDFFFVRGVPLNPPRPYWAVWQEGGKYPDLIIELSSPTTQKEDLTTKKDLYERVFRTYEYFCYDPTDGLLKGWRLVDHIYQSIMPNERGWLWCNELGLWLGAWRGKFQSKENTYLRFYDAHGNLIPTSAEASRGEALSAKQDAEAAKQDASTAKQDAAKAKEDAAKAKEDAAKAKEDAAKANKLAEVERKRADAAEAELARLRAQVNQDKR